MPYIVERGTRKTARGKYVRTSRVKNVSFYCEAGFDSEYDSSFRRPLISHFQFLLDVKRGGGKDREFLREQAEMIRRCMDQNSPLLRGFFHEEPSWRTELLDWTDRLLKETRRSGRPARQPRSGGIR